jgi:hypothetical protein
MEVTVLVAAGIAFYPTSRLSFGLFHQGVTLVMARKSQKNVCRAYA